MIYIDIEQIFYLLRRADDVKTEKNDRIRANSRGRTQLLDFPDHAQVCHCLRILAH